MNRNLLRMIRTLTGSKMVQTENLQHQKLYLLFCCSSFAVKRVQNIYKHCAATAQTRLGTS